MNPNMVAFLTTIAVSEGTQRYPDPYRVVFGGKYTIVNLSDHPAITGEWHGESLAFLGPAYAHEISTAAGRYQINKPTWLYCRGSIDLPTFEPQYQDAAAVFLIEKHGAQDLVEQGHFAQAIWKCCDVWASLPGNTSGQPQHSFAALSQVYTDAGGILA